MRQEIIRKFISAALSAIERGVFSFKFLSSTMSIVELEEGWFTVCSEAGAILNLRKENGEWQASLA